MLALAWGLTSSVSKDANGNLLLARLSRCFEQEHESRKGKRLTGDHLPAQNTFDLEEIRLKTCEKHTRISLAYHPHLKATVKDRRQNSVMQ